MTKKSNWIFTISILVILTLWGISIWWSWMPPIYNVKQRAIDTAKQLKQKMVPGYTTTTTLIDMTEWLIHKHGGFLSNDISPPGIFMDNMPSFEYGVLEQIRDLSLVMRLDFSRSQSQSNSNPDLQTAQTKLYISRKSWTLPSSEQQYSEAVTALKQYRAHLVSHDYPNAQFYPRADNLNEWLRVIEKSLGSMSQRLSASVGQERFNVDLASDTTAKQSTKTPAEEFTKTPWLQIDNVFYESRGASWAILHFLNAIEIDFADVLKKKKATASMKQIIRDLDYTQTQIWTPILLNGSGFGILANHSLVMANYISRANASIIDLRNLLKQG